VQGGTVPKRRVWGKQGLPEDDSVSMGRPDLKGEGTGRVARRGTFPHFEKFNETRGNKRVGGGRSEISDKTGETNVHVHPLASNQ